MFKNALDYLVSLGKEAATNQVHDVNGVLFAGGDLELAPVLMPAPDRLNIATLTGLVDYIAANRDELDLTKMVAVVESPTRVSLCGPLMHATEQRPVYVRCEPLLPSYKLETHLDSEHFNLMLQSCFVNTEDRATLLSFVACIAEESSVTTEDSGVGQVVVAKTGIARRGDVVAPSPVTLRPYRTFTEIEQPESPFVLRMRTPGPQLGLWVADGGKWRNDAMLNIKAFLESKLDGVTILA